MSVALKMISAHRNDAWDPKGAFGADRRGSCGSATPRRDRRGPHRRKCSHELLASAESWREPVSELLAEEDGPDLYVSGTVTNQSRFYSRFDAVVLLSAPAYVLLRRIGTRATNNYGKSVEDRDLILQHVAEIEPLLRATCTHEIDATQPIHEVVQQLIAIGGGDDSR